MRGTGLGPDENARRYVKNASINYYDPRGLDQVSTDSEGLRAVYWEPAHIPIGFRISSTRVKLFEEFGGGYVGLGALRLIASRVDLNSINGSFLRSPLESILRGVTRLYVTPGDSNNRDFNPRQIEAELERHFRPLSDWDRRLIGWGCVGLSMYRLGMERYPNNHPDARIFRSEFAARAVREGLGENRWALVAVQTGSATLDCGNIQLSGEWNYAIWLDDSLAWEWANHGWNFEGPGDAVIRHRNYLPTLPTAPYTFYVLVPR